MLRFLLCFSALLSYAFECSANINAATPPPAVFIPKEISHFLPYLPKVNVITGEYNEEECDLVVAGNEPISYLRFYGHQGHRDLVYGHWRVNPECQVLFNFNQASSHRLVGVGEEDGTLMLSHSCPKLAPF